MIQKPRIERGLDGRWKQASALRTGIVSVNALLTMRGVCCEADSRCEHPSQAADFLAGAVKFKIDVGLARRDLDAIPKYVEKATAKCTKRG